MAERVHSVMLEPPAAPAFPRSPGPGVALPAPHRPGWRTVILGALALGIVAVLFKSGEAGRAALAGLAYLPFLLLGAMFRLRTRWLWLGGLTWGYVWLLVAGFGVMSLLFTGAALVPAGSTEFAPGVGSHLLEAAWLIFGGVLLGVVLVGSGWWLPLGSRLGGRLERGRPAHAQGVVLLVCFTIIAFAPLVALGAKAPLLQMVQHNPAALDQARSQGGQLLDQLYSLGWTLLVALVAAGVPLRDGRALLARLGLQRLPRRDLPVLGGVVFGLIGLGFAVDAFTSLVWGWAGWPRTDAHAVNQLLGAVTVISPLGALVTGVTAGLGEELLTRGLLQPRFGWLLPNLAFTAVHAYQYGPDAVLSVFIVGSVLAAVRARWNTSASALVHGGYDGVLLLGQALGLPGFS